MIGRDEGWRLSCEADADLYEPATVQGLRRSLAPVPGSAGDVARLPPGRLSGAPGHFPARRRRARFGGAPQPIPVHDPAQQVVRFHEDGSRTPMIVLNNRSVYFQLARQLGEIGPSSTSCSITRMARSSCKSYAFEDFAAYAVRLIRWAQPRGPYVLGGHCVYGVLAFEAARQLQRMGEKVELVALFDSWAPGYRETMSGWDQHAASAAAAPSSLWPAPRAVPERRGRPERDRAQADPLPPRPAASGTGDPSGKHFAGEWFDDYLYDAVARYRPSPYDGDVVLFRSNEPLRGRLFDERMGWGPLVSGSLKKVDVDSGHFDMFRERPAGEIASFLQTW